MVRKALKFLAATVFGFLLVAAVIVGMVFGMMHKDAPVHVALAEDVARDLSSRWHFADIRDTFLPAVAAEIDESRVQTAFNTLSRLGVLLEIKDPLQSDYDIRFDPATGITRKATVAFTAVYAHGEATVTVILVTQDGVTKAQHLNVKPIRIPQPKHQRSLA